MENIEKIRAHLASLLDKKSENITDIAQKIGVSHQTLYNFKNGSDNIRKSTIEKIESFIDNNILEKEIKNEEEKNNHNDYLSIVEKIELYKKKISEDIGVKKEDVDIIIKF